MNGSQIERISQEGKCRNESESGILEDASAFAHGVLEEIKILAGTTACKSVQLVRLKKWAQEPAGRKPIRVFRQGQVNCEKPRGGDNPTLFDNNPALFANNLTLLRNKSRFMVTILIY